MSFFKPNKEERLSYFAEGMKNANRQYLWEDLLEEDLSRAEPKEVLEIIKVLNGWLFGFCRLCGTYNVDMTPLGCQCPDEYKWKGIK